nr:hypothetical protein [Deltaproteobacteria bacterium]
MADTVDTRGPLETRGTLVIVGSGGHAKVVLATARRAGWSSIELADDDPARAGYVVLGVPVSRSAQAALADADARCVIAIGDNATRARLAASAACGFVTLVDPAAYVHDSARLG